MFFFIISESLNYLESQNDVWTKQLSTLNKWKKWQSKHKKSVKQYDSKILLIYVNR